MPRREHDVANTYSAIFTEDPLLLEAQNQKKYSDALLKHLLINRAVSSCEPFDLNVNDDDSRLNFEDQPVVDAPPPPLTVLTDYEDSVRYRVPMKNESDFDKIAETTMASDATFTIARSSKLYPVHEEADAELKSRGKSSRMNDRLRIAAIGYRVKISKLVGTGNFNEDLCRLPLQPDLAVTPLPEGPTKDQLRHTLPLNDQTEWENTILSHIELALKRHSQIVLLPEFALPPPRSDGKKLIDTRIQELASSAPIDTFVFAGTRHEGKYNRGLVVSKAGARVDPWWHYKVAPALKLGENVLGPKGIRIPTYIKPLRVKGVESTFACTVAVCYDAFDISMFLNLIKLSTQSGMRWKQLVILVPSFNTSPDFVAMLRDLSFLARCVIVYVNGLHGDAKMFICGFSVSEILNRRGQIVKRVASMKEEIDTAIADEDKTFRERVSKNSSADRTPEEKKRVSDWDDMLIGLDRIHSVMSELEESGGLDHLITIEELPPDPKDPSAGTKRTADDILYYNIDIGFLTALRLYRRYFFCGDKFLPKPFHYDELSTAFGKRPNR